ncbi:MAG TPA: arylsulfatase [Gemmata sp.]|jgi:arylsulfatase A-like enzyme|nr:arylsulfatase [Gemmata sp.]
MKNAILVWFTVLLVAIISALRVNAASPPNVLLVITDDQGFGDLGAHGNPVIKTPNLDAFAKESAWLKKFYVCPVCSPTRSGLLTGQYNYRTGIVDTFVGRSLMRPDIPTLPEILASAGYRTGLFGKWHLGDNYPLRPEDRGFQETLWSQGGGLAQPSDAPGVDPKTAYFDPMLKQNGKEVKTKGYCTDVFTAAALKFISADSSKPFFAYVAYNCPHDPFQVPEELAAHYAKLNLTAGGFPKIGQPWAMGKVNTDAIARAYGMIENIDTNFARLLKALEEKKLADNTIVIFMTDNGTGGVRFAAGLRNRKGTVYEGGIRVPFYIRGPGIKEPAAIDSAAAHIDIAPTLFDLCGVKLKDAKPAFDGQSLAGLLRGSEKHLPDRTLFFQWHRGDAPEKYRAFAARGPRYKLVQANGAFDQAKWQKKFELFDISADPFEEKDLAAEKPDEVAKLMNQYEDWFADVTKNGFTPPRIIIGSEKENPVRLSRQDWRGPKAGWAPDSIGHWEVKIEKAGKYKVTLWSPGEFDAFNVTVGDVVEKSVRKEMKDTTSLETQLAAGPANIEATVTAGGKNRGVTHVQLEYVGK